jgi:hypothetical protein
MQMFSGAMMQRQQQKYLKRTEKSIHANALDEPVLIRLCILVAFEILAHIRQDS